MKKLVTIISLSFFLSGCAGALLTLSGVAGGMSIANSIYGLYDTYMSRIQETETKQDCKCPDEKEGK